MSEKVTWDDVYKNFRLRHPNLRNDVVGFRPYEYSTILVYLSDGRKMTYNYDTKISKFVSIVEEVDNHVKH